MAIFLDDRLVTSKDRSSIAEVLRWMPRGVRDFLTSDRELADAPQAVMGWLHKEGLVKKADRKTSGEYSYTYRGVEVRARAIRRRDLLSGGL